MPVDGLSNAFSACSKIMVDNIPGQAYHSRMVKQKPLNRSNGSGVASHPNSRSRQDALGSRLHYTAFGSRKEGRHERSQEREATGRDRSPG